MQINIKKIDLSSLALYSFIFYSVFGLLAILPFWSIGIFIGSLMPQDFYTEEMPFSIFELFNSFLVLFFIGISAVLGTFMNTFLAFIYNIISMKMGGLKMVLEINKKHEDHSLKDWE